MALLESTPKEVNNNFDSKGKLFAYDAKITQRIKNADGVAFQLDLDKLKEWSQKWLLQFNEEKCKRIKSAPLGPDLGVIITNDLKPSRQVSKAAVSANFMLGLLNMTMTCLDSEMLLTLYKSLVRP
ncbi:hypothetical protein Pcinc_027380 [Petrolisthes cinctipes]|uniref:Uncharacterized protein n=1 Tax=Petrolisthes cinctipes TaxID=88211 RepID=A0AAE1F4N5_PETCI|nr:hypothetical protein Pcinc_027380 [Petrolisthes cinctipes]